jgi:hypothetical protein
MAPHIQEFIFGASRVFDLGNTLQSKRVRRIIFDDNAAIYDDWRTVGNDIKQAVAQYDDSNERTE